MGKFMKKLIFIFLTLCSQIVFAQWHPQTIIIQQRPSINPMQGPIDYSSNVQNPFDAARQGFELGRAMREEQERRERLAQQRAEQEASRVQSLQMQRMMAEQIEQMQQQQKILAAQTEELKRLREANANLNSVEPSK